MKYKIAIIFGVKLIKHNLQFSLAMKINENFDIAFSSIKKPSKLRCGDHIGIEFLDEESILIAMVCDGISSCPADYLASEMVCSRWSSCFKEAQGTISERIVKATLIVNEELLSVEGTNKGLMTTQTLVVYDFLNQHLHLQNIGDSRTYIQRKSELIQVTEDDAKSVILQDRSGKPLKTKDGFVITATAINNAIGQLGIKTNVKTFLAKEAMLIRGIVLVSDGFYGCPNFEQDSLHILSEIDMQEALDVVMKKNLDYQKDDMTAIFIRQKTKSLLSNKNMLTFLMESSQEKISNEYSIIEIAKYILEKLEIHLQNLEDVKTTLDLLNLTDKLSIDFGRKKYIQLYDLYKMNKVMSKDVAQSLINKMRRSNKP